MRFRNCSAPVGASGAQRTDWEVPTDADLAIDTADITPEEGAQAVILHLERKGYVAPSR